MGHHKHIDFNRVGNTSAIGRAFSSVLLVSLILTTFPGRADAATVVYLTSGTSWTVPSDWNSSNNTIEVIGGGGGGGGGGSGGSDGRSGGGGAYSKITNVSLTAATAIAYAVGSGGAGGANSTAGTSGGDTYFCSSSSDCASISGAAVVAGAKGGQYGDNTCSATGSGGSSASGVGTTKYSGGTGGCGVSPTVAGGGGGAAGPNGTGGDGTGGAGTGGNGDAGIGGAGGVAGSAGGAGTEWDATHGSGGGAGGGSSGPGPVGGSYGGGGGAGVISPSNTEGGTGAQGIIVITYTPLTITLTKSTTVTGDAAVFGTISKGAGTFVIDHPLDPKNKLLYHSFVESPDVLNIYDGIATLDKNGEATIKLPRYFLALNKDFTYLGTAIGEPMPNLFLSKEVHRWFFGLFGRPVIKISGGAPGGRVSWQVTGIRKDPFILARPIIPEVDKGPDQPADKGEFICPECYAE